MVIGGRVPGSGNSKSKISKREIYLQRNRKETRMSGGERVNLRKNTADIFLLSKCIVL